MHVYSKIPHEKKEKKNKWEKEMNKWKNKKERKKNKLSSWKTHTWIWVIKPQSMKLSTQKRQWNRNDIK